MLLGALAGIGILNVGVLPVASLPAAAATGPAGCGYGTSGAAASQLCWLDMSAYNDTTARSAAGQNLTISLPGGYTVSFNVKTTTPAGFVTDAVTAAATPTWSGAYMGNKAYLSIPGKPALYAAANVSKGAFTVTISNITVTDSAGAAVRGYGMVAADAESSNTGESLSFSSNSSLAQINNVSANLPICGGGLTGVGTTSVSCVGADATASKALFLQADSPTTIAASGFENTISGRQGVAFAFVTSQLTLNKTVTARSNPSDSFSTAITSAQGTVVGSASTGTGATSTTGKLTVLPLSSGQPYTLAETPTPGTTTNLAAYSASWSCSNANTASSTVLPSGSGTSKTVVPLPGDDITCTITNTPIVDLHVSKSASPNPYVPGRPFSYTVTVTNTGPANALGAAVSDPLPAGLAAAGFSWTCTASTGSTCKASGTGNITDTVNVAAGGTLTYTVTGTVPAGQTAPLTNTATLTPPAGTSDPGCSPNCTSTVPVASSPILDLSVTKSSSPTPYLPGQPLTYTITVANAGPSTAKGAAVSDPLPAALAGFTWTCTPSPGSSCTASGAGNISDTVTIPPGGQVVYKVTGSVPAGTTGSLVNTATVTPPSGTTDPNCTPSCAATNSNPFATVDLAISKTASPSPYTAGQPLTYTVTVTNAGPSAATGASVSDPLPSALAGAGFTWTCAPSAGSSCSASGTGSITDTVNIAAGGRVVYTLTGTVPSTTSGTLSNTASATPPPGSIDPGCSPNCAATNEDAQMTVGLSVAKSSTPNPYVAGQPLTYTVMVSNTGPQAAIGATVSDPLPSALQGAGFTWTCAATSGGSCTASGSGNITDTVNIPAGGTVTYVVTGTIPLGTTGQLTNTVTVTPPAGTSNPDCTPNCSAIDLNPATTVDLKVTKSVDPDPYLAGHPLAYTVAVTNGGPGPAIGATVADPLPSALQGAGFTWTCAPSEGSSCTPSGSGSITDSVNIAAGGQLVYTVTGTVPPTVSGTLTNIATVTPPPGTADSACSPDCFATNADPEAPVDLSITKQATPDPYLAGQPLTYTITATNAGPGAAVGAKVSDPLPPGLAGAGFTWTCAPSAGSSCSASGSGSITDTVTIAAGGQVVYTLSGTVPSTTSGILTNTATLTPPSGVVDPDCNPSCSAPNVDLPATVGLSVAKTSTPNPYLAGEPLTYTVTVTNTGPDAATGTAVSDPLPSALSGAGFTWTCAPSTGSSCTPSGSGNITDTVTIAAGGQVVYSLSGTVPSSVTGTLANTTTVTPPPGASDPACSPNCSATDQNSQTAVALSVSKTSTPNPYLAGQPLTYTFTVTNAGPDPAVGAAVSDPLPPALAGAGFTWTCAGTAGSSCTASGAFIISNTVFDTVSLAVGGSVTYVVTGTVPSSATGTLTNTVTVDSPPGASDPTCSPNCSSTNQNPASTVGLAVSKTSTPNPYVAGQPLTYTVTVTNAGPDPAIGAAVSDPLPSALAGAGFTWTCAPSSGSSCTPSGSGSITDTVTIAAGGLVVYTLTGTVPSSATGTLTNTATVTPPASASDPACSPDCSSSNQNPVSTVGLSVAKTSSPNPYLAGQPLTYTVTVTNAGPDAATGATVSDPLPSALQGAGFTWTCAPSSGSSCAASGLGSITDTVTIAAGGQVVYTLTGTVPSTATGTLNNTATVTPAPGASDAACSPDCSSTNANLPTTVGLSVAKTSTPNPYLAGQPLTYTVTVSNAGPDPAIGAAVSDPLPSALAGAGFTWTCAASTGSSCTPSGSGSITDTVTMAAGGQVVYKLSGTVPSSATGTLTNTATVDPPPGTNDPTCSPNCSAPNVDIPATVGLAVAKTATPDPYVAGQPLTYTVTVTNAGPDPATGAAVSDPLPSALAGAGFTWTCVPSSGSTCTASGSGSITDSVTIPAGGQVVYALSGTVPSTATGTLTNTATVTPPAGASDPTCSPNCSSTNMDLATTVGLAVSKTSSPNPYVPGQPLTYTFTVTNAGPDPAIGAAVSDPLPSALAGAGFSWTCAATTGSSCTASGAFLISNTVDDTVNLAVGGSVTYVVSGTVPSSATGTLTNTATVTPPAGISDPACSPNCSATNVDPATTVATVGLAVAKTATPDPYVAGQPLTYTVTVTNAGPDPATGAAVSDPLPSALAGAGFTWTCVPSSGSTCTASGSGSITDSVTIPAGGQVVYALSGTVPSTATGTLTNTATVTPPSGTSDSACSPNCSSTNVDPATTVSTVGLAVAKTATPDPYVAGQPLTYTVTVTNTGPDAATGAAVSDPLPSALAGAGFTWTCAPSSGSTCTPSGSGSITDSVTIPAGGQVVYTLSGTVPSSATGTLTNTATVTPPSGTSDPACSPNCSATNVDPATTVSTVGLAVAKTSSPNPYMAGQPLTYTVTVTNTGPDAATGAAVSDPLPSALVGAGFTWTCVPSSGSTCTASGSGSITDSVTIPAGGQVVYTLSGTVPSSATGTLTNTATVTPPAGTSDPACSPNCSSTNVDPATTVSTVGLAVAKTSSPNPYVAGQPLTYTVTVTNNGPDAATGAAVSDPLPSTLAGAGFTWTCAPSSGSTCTASGSGSITDSVTIPAGGQVVYTLSGTVPSSATGTLTNTATVTPPAGISDPACSNGCSSTNQNPGPTISTVGLAVAKTATPDPYVAGQPLTYTVTVTNNGPDAATGAAVSDPLPSALVGAGFTWTCVPSSGSICTASGSGSITDSVTIPAGGQVVYTLSGTGPSSATGTLTNTATVTPPAGTSDSACSPNCSATKVDPASSVSTVGLAAAKTAMPNPYVAGQPLTYTVTVTNTGPDAATGATASDPLPSALSGAGFTWTCAGSTGSSCTPSGSGSITDSVTIPAGGQVVYTLTGTVPSTATGTLTNTATVTPPSGTSDPACSPNCSSTNVDPATTVSTVGLAVAKTSSPNPYVAGQPLTYTVTVTNTGPDPATGAAVSDPLPSALAGAGFTWTCVPSSGSTCTSSGSGSITDSVTIPAGGQVVYTLSGTVPSSATGTLTNTATATPPAGTSDPACGPNCSATNLNPTPSTTTTTPSTTTTTISPSPASTTISPSPVSASQVAAPQVAPQGSSPFAPATPVSQPVFGLPFTGLDPDGLSLAGVALLAGGFTLQRVARRRRRGSP